MRILAFFILLITRISLAAPASILEAGGCISSENIRTGNISFTQIPCIALGITNKLLSLVGYISLVVIIIGGLFYVFGGVNEEWKGKGKEAVKLAIVGAIVSWSAWFIVNLIIDNI